jgi:carboxymethylenebutenolidase
MVKAGDGGAALADVTIPTSAGAMPGYLSRPHGQDPWPGVVVLHDEFGIDQAVREQADWLASAGYLALSADLGFWGRPAVCLARMFGELRSGHGQTFGQIDAARAWLAGQPGCSGRIGVIGFCATGGFALLTAAGHGFAVSAVNYGLVRKNAADALQGACPIVASFGAKDRALRKAPQRLAQAVEKLGIEHDIKVYPDAGHAFLHQSAGEPGPVMSMLVRLTHAGYHEASARDARSRIIAFFDAHLKQ